MFLLIGATFLCFAAYNYFLEVFYDTGDSIRHFQFAYWAPRHPLNLMDLWAKPFFTLLTMPFAIWGYYGIILFNILVSCASCWVMYLIGKKLEYRYLGLIVPLTVFATIYFAVINSGLTEPLFALFCLLPTYLYMNKRFVTGSMMVSFLPLIRSEGTFILVLFLIVLVIRKQWKSIPLLAFGVLVYSIAGAVLLDDFFWIKNRNPYGSRTDEMYGKGEFTRYLNAFDYIMGHAQAVLMAIGIIGALATLYRWIQSKKIWSRKNYHIEEWVLIYGTFIAYFLAHSYFWWKGGFGSYGLVRVFGGVSPMGSFMALVGFNFAMLNLPIKKPWFKILMVALVLFFVIREPFTTGANQYWKGIQSSEKVCIQAVNWLNTENLNIDRLFVLHPFIPFKMERDVFSDESTPFWGLYNGIEKWGYDKAIPQGSVLVWDSSFGPREGELPLETLLSDPNFKLLRSFNDIGMKRTDYQKPFSIHVFLRVPPVKRSPEMQSYLEKVNKVRSEIETNYTWLEDIYQKAEQRGISPDSMKILDARFIVDQGAAVD